jgi:hypothetical protein
MASKKLFEIACEPTIAKVYDVSVGAQIFKICTGFEIWAHNNDSIPAQATGVLLSEVGPYIAAVPKYRDVRPEEPEIKKL